MPSHPFQMFVVDDDVVSSSDAITQILMTNFPYAILDSQVLNEILQELRANRKQLIEQQTLN